MKTPLAILAKTDVAFLIVGGDAVLSYGYSRTADLGNESQCGSPAACHRNEAACDEK